MERTVSPRHISDEDHTMYYGKVPEPKDWGELRLFAYGSGKYSGEVVFELAKKLYLYTVYERLSGLPRMRAVIGKNDARLHR